MLIGIIGDIHANIEALNATLDALDRLCVTKIYCTGDVVGYGGAPAECIQTVRERNIDCTCGNHDSYVAHPGIYDNRNVRQEATQVIEWTRSVLSEKDIQWLSSLPLFIENDDFMVTHASCQPYPQWKYVTSPRTASIHLLFQQNRLCFNGHSHVPILASHKPGHKVQFDFFHETTIQDDCYTVVGVGAVGQPRDDDPRACAMLYDTEEHTVKMLRVQYDIKKAQQRIFDNNLPPSLATRIALGK